jgi:hypothetical protein
MGDATNMPPVSGEIMAGDSRRDGPTPFGPRGDVVDADFVTLPKDHARAALAAPTAEAAIGAQPVSPPVGLDVLRPVAPLSGSRRAGGGFWAAGAIAVAAAFWMSGGHTLSRYLPSGGADGDGIRVAGLTSRIADTALGRGLFIDGEVRNTATGRALSPNLLIDVTAQDGLVTRYRLATGAGQMASGEARRFSSRLAAPESGVRSVSVAIDREGRD